MKVTLSGNFQISISDEVQILRGKGNPGSGQILATTLSNVTRGITFRSVIEDILDVEMPHDFVPQIHGYARNVEIYERSVSFELEENAPPMISPILRECKRFLDAQLYERCKDKDYHDVVTNAFPILED